MIRSFCWWLIIAVVVNLVGCGAPSDSSTTSVKITIARSSAKQKSAMAPAFSFINSFVVIVTGEGMDPVLGVGPGFASGQNSSSFTMLIPKGLSRLFNVEGRDKNGKVIFKGSATRDLEGTSALVPIEITPFQFTKVFFSPATATSTPKVGEIFSREIEVFDVQGAFYAAFSLTYDPNVIEYLNGTEGNLLKGDGQTTFFQEALEKGTLHKVTVGITRLGKVANLSGSGKLMTLSFRAIGPGTSSITFTDPKAFRSRNHQDVTVDDWENGSVTVTQ